MKPVKPKKRLRDSDSSSSSSDLQEPSEGGSEAVPQPQGPKKLKRTKLTLEPKLLGGTEPDQPPDSGQLGDKVEHKPTNDYLPRDGWEVPVPFEDREAEWEALYVAKLKKLKAQKEQREKDEEKAADVETNVYDPFSEPYKGIKPRNDYMLFADYNRKSKRERGIGELAASIELKFFDPNYIRLDYTLVFCGRRGSGKTYLMRWLLYKLRRWYPYGLCFTRTKVTCHFGVILPPTRPQRGIRHIPLDADENTLLLPAFVFDVC